MSVLAKPIDARGVPGIIPEPVPIKTLERPICPVCGRDGELFHTALADWLYSVPGRWNVRRCRGCEALWLDPQPARDDIPKLYVRYLTHSTHATRSGLGRLQHDVTQSALSRAGYSVAAPSRLVPRLLAHWPGAQKYARLSVMGLPPGTGGTLLDVGCGNGEFLGRMRALGWQVSGVEPDPAAVACGRESGLEIFTGTIFDLPRDARYEAITLSHVIEHVGDPIGFLEQCRVRLRSGVGRLIITTPNARSLGRRWFGRFWRGLEVPRHFTIFSPPAMRECVERAGFRVLSMSTETRLAPMIYKQSGCAKSGETEIGSRGDFAAHAKIAAHLFRFLESLLVRAGNDLGEEIFCVCEPLS